MTDSITKTNRLENLKAAVINTWALVMLCVFIVIFSFTGRGFFSLMNFQNIIHLSTMYILLGAAETFVIITGGIDLSVGFVMGLSSVSAAKIMQVLYASGNSQAASILTGITAAVLISFLPGLINGMLVTRFRVPPFIATLGMWGICNGVTLRVAGGWLPVGFLPEKLTTIGNGYLLYIMPGKNWSLFSAPAGVADDQIRSLVRILPNSTIFIVIVILILRFILNDTRFGRHTYAIGGKIDAAIRSGIDTNRHLMKIYVLSSLLAGLAGVFNVFQTGIGNYTPFSASYELFAVAAVVIGGASLLGGSGKIGGTVTGILLISVLENGLLISGVAPFYRYIAVGLLLILSVVIDKFVTKLDKDGAR